MTKEEIDEKFIAHREELKRFLNGVKANRTATNEFFLTVYSFIDEETILYMLEILSDAFDGNKKSFKDFTRVSLTRMDVATVATISRTI